MRAPTVTRAASPDGGKRLKNGVAFFRRQISCEASLPDNLDVAAREVVEEFIGIMAQTQNEVS